MKYIYTILILSLSAPAFAAEPFFLPTGRCLDKISAAMKSLGTSKIEIENEIDFEGFLDKTGSKFTFMYYKVAPGKRTLDITGKGSIDLAMKATSEFQDLTYIEDCDVSNPRILEEIED